MGLHTVNLMLNLQLDMHDEDEIDVMIHQHGGGKRE